MNYYTVLNIILYSLKLLLTNLLYFLGRENKAVCLSFDVDVSSVSHVQ